MTIVSTRLYTVDVPELFEKVVQFGQLLRAERMDRPDHEASFAELNLFVGALEEENLGVASDAPSDVILLALQSRTLEAERQLETLPEDYLEAEERRDHQWYANWRVAAAPWRPESGRLLSFVDFPGTAPRLFASVSLEFDFSMREVYVPLWEAMLESLEWRDDRLVSEGVDQIKDEAYSIFDGMSDDRRQAIQARYMAIIGRRTPTRVEPPAPSVIDLREFDGADVPADAFAAAFEPYESQDLDCAVAHLRCSFLPDPVELTCYLLEAELPELCARAAQLASVLAKLTEANHAEAGRYLWEHCQIHFEATDYGAPEGQSNEDYFGIHGPDSALAEVGAGSVYIGDALDGEDEIPGHLFTLTFYPPWEDEHGCALVVHDGKIKGWATPGDPLDSWYTASQGDGGA